MHVVATAGHVDHGKSTLVRALTGSDPDRLEEEHRRGLSIQLGYCWTSLDDAGDVAFVDVPGHQRFITTTLSGLGPVPVTMFVVAADDPWMPQAAEHLSALDALGVARGVLVVTRSDLADPRPALDRARIELSRTSLSGIPDVAVSGRTGAGIDELRTVLSQVLRSIPSPAPDTDVRLWVDRRFTIHGIGTVVTGTLPAGTISVGDVLACHDTLVRVRGMECLDTRVDSVSGPARVALDLGGRAPADLVAGSVLVTPEAYEPTTTVDVALIGEGRLPARPLLHVGTLAVEVRARALGRSTARLALPGALPLRVADRAILRDPGSRRGWGIRVLDVNPAPLRRRGDAAVRAQTLEVADGSVAFALQTRPVVRRSALRRMGIVDQEPVSGAVAVGDWLVSQEQARQWRQELTALVAHPTPSLRNGVALAEVVSRLRLPDATLVPALLEPPLRLEEGYVRAGGNDTLPDLLATAVSELHADLAENPFRAPLSNRLQALGLDAGAIAALHRRGYLLRLAEGIVLLPGADAAAVVVLSGLPQPFTVSEARQSLDTSRRVVLPLLAHLDRAGRTLRLPDDRRRLRQAEGS